MDGISVAAVATGENCLPATLSHGPDTTRCAGLCAIVALPYFLWTRLFHPSGPPAAVKGERDVLERLYRETDGPNWVKNEHWGDPAVPIGRWHGVKVSHGERYSPISNFPLIMYLCLIVLRQLNGSGHVHKLILPRNRLRGVPPCTSRPSN